MQMTRLSSKGQVIIPKSVRDAHGWLEGLEFFVEETPDGILLRPANPFPETKLEDVFGMLKYDGPPKTIDEINRGIDEALAEKWGKGRT